MSKMALSPHSSLTKTLFLVQKSIVFSCGIGSECFLVLHCFPNGDFPIQDLNSVAIKKNRSFLVQMTSSISQRSPETHVIASYVHVTFVTFVALFKISKQHYKVQISLNMSLRCAMNESTLGKFGPQFTFQRFFVLHLPLRDWEGSFAYPVLPVAESSGVGLILFNIIFL